MRVYRLSTRLKLGLILFAFLIAVASLFYTNQLANKLQERETEVLAQWVRALELRSGSLASPYTNSGEFTDLRNLVAEREEAGFLSQQRAIEIREAISWAESMPPAELILFLDELNAQFLEGASLPVILSDTLGNVTLQPLNISVDSGFSDAEKSQFYRDEMERLDGLNDPLRIEIQVPGMPPLVQLAHYGEPVMVERLRIFPYIQLLFVSLFVVVGYLGFSYVRRHEQSHLWVGMAKEAAHQLGTPTSSLMGWVELLRASEMDPVAGVNVPDELDKDVARLQRVANRFSRIGSKPTLRLQSLQEVINTVTDYIRPRIPQKDSRDIRLEVVSKGDISVPLDAELFEWVLENLLKNALDAIPGDGVIRVTLRKKQDRAIIAVMDSGKGIPRSAQSNIFRPGFSTKQRGWGLGLSLAKRIVENYHSGTIDLVSSKPGEGSTFEIALPVEEGKKIRRPGKFLLWIRSYIR